MSYDLTAHVATAGGVDFDADAWTAHMAHFMVFDGGDSEKRAVRSTKLAEELNEVIKQHWRYIDELELLRLPNIQTLPVLSFYVRFVFTLARPYISRDDEVWYPEPNSIRKDKLLKLPYIEPSFWKGHLRSAIRLGQKPDDDPVVIRLFGSPKPRAESGDDLVQGRLVFYPTFFKKISREVINPHDRATKAGTMPIFFECVPRGESGEFRLLYVPHLALNGALPGSKEMIEQVKEDMRVVFQGIRDMALGFGFSAKKNAGYGEAEDQVLLGEVCLHRPQLKDMRGNGSGKPPLPEVCSAWLDESGRFPVYDKKARQEMLGSGRWTKSQMKRYMEAKRAWDDYQNKLATPVTDEQALPQLKKSFGRISDLPAIAEAIWSEGGSGA